MPVPPLKTIEMMGKELIKERDMTENRCDKILRSFIYEQDRLSTNNIERVASTG